VSDWEQQFAAMRVQFLQRAGDRMAKMAEALAKLSANPNDFEALTEVRQHFHWLSGVGGTYKMPAVSDIGIVAEELCDGFINDKATPSLLDLENLRDMMERAKVLMQAERDAV
jgi:chemotaxis protein histidine kinase CheA